MMLTNLLWIASIKQNENEQWRIVGCRDGSQPSLQPILSGSQ
jgi:hypothetical protein